jgi:toxin FitB
MYLLDTNVVSEPRKPKPHGAVFAWFKDTHADLIFIPAIVFGEIQFGIERTRKQDAAKADLIDDWANNLVASSNLVRADAAIFRRHAIMMQGQSDDLWEDALIAATALEQGLTVVTRNTRDFEPFGVKLLNPFEYAA